MRQEAILLPLAALAGLTFVVLLMIPYARFKAAREGLVAAEDFKYGESPSVPGSTSIPNRNLMNLLELPVLFYVACLTLYATKTVDGLAVALAWLYFALRVGHSAIHLTYNKVFHRLSLFAASNVVLIALWIRLVVRLA
jgi:hypothetical protein